MSAKPKIRVIFTGGTISMRHKEGRGAVPELTSHDLFATVPEVRDFCDASLHDFGQLPGPHMTPDRMLELSGQIEADIASGFDGVVVTHGTDTLEETAYLCDLRHETKAPVVFVGAMRNSSQLSWDGPINLYQACQVACEPGFHDKGVLVVMNSTIHAAAEVTKTYTEALDTFQAPDTGPMGIIDGDQILHYRDPRDTRRIPTKALERRVSMVTATAGDDGGMIDHLTQRGEKGIVIEALGRGNLPPDMAAGVDRAIAKGVVIVATSRCWGGRVSDAYGYDGGGARLKDAGVIFAPAMAGPKVRIALMAALGHGMNRDQIQHWFEQ